MPAVRSGSYDEAEARQLEAAVDAAEAAEVVEPAVTTETRPGLAPVFLEPKGGDNADADES